MRTLVLLALAGLGAQLVDGSLGMAYGVTSTTLLLSMGTNPAAASATVHLAEIGTTLMSGASHWRFGNVDWKVVAKIGVPGAVGAFPRRDRAVRAVHRDRRAGDVADPARARAVRAVPVHVPRPAQGESRQAAA
ncbi:sulfite exporter TauE/SafE family protein [Streptomyces sp. GTA36]